MSKLTIMLVLFITAPVSADISYDYDNGRLAIHNEGKLVAALDFDDFPEKLEGIETFDDGTMIITANKELSFSMECNFEPDYIGENGSELYLVGGGGGICVYPQKRGDIEYEDYRWTMQPGSRVMVNTFPSKPFDYETYFSREYVTITALDDGSLPTEAQIEAIAKNFTHIIVREDRLYIPETRGSEGPYMLRKPDEFAVFCMRCRKHGIGVLPYTSFFYQNALRGSIDNYLPELQELWDVYDIAGFYVDGRLMDAGSEKHEDKIASYQIFRAIREMVGKDGVIVYHATCLGGVTARTPNIENMCDFVTVGEGVALDSMSCDYVKYYLENRNISNVPCGLITNYRGLDKGEVGEHAARTWGKRESWAMRKRNGKLEYTDGSNYAFRAYKAVHEEMKLERE